MAAVVDPTRGPVLLSISVGTACFALSSCFVRFCVRTRITNNLGYDDYAIGMAGIVALIATIFSVVESVSMGSSAQALEFDYLGQPWFMMGATLAKISICLFFLRLVGTTRQWRVLLCVQIFLMAVVNLAFAMTTNLQCMPLKKLWKPAVPGSCWDPRVQKNIGYTQGTFNVFWWFFLALVPVLIVRDMDMKRALRWPFYLLAGLGFIAGIFTIVRTYMVSRSSGLSTYTYDTFSAAMLAVLEQNVGIVAANALPLGPLFSRRGRGGGSVAAGAGHSGSQPTHGSTIKQKRTAAVMVEAPREGGMSFESELPSQRPSRSQSQSQSRAQSRSDSRISDRGVGRSLSRKLTRTLGHMRNDSQRSLSSIGSRSSVGTRRIGNHSRAGSNASLGSLNAEDAAAAWPRGIIRTVEVEVIEEDLADIETGEYDDLDLDALESGRASARASALTIEQDWETMLRTGPPPGNDSHGGLRG